jgi:hypothetical protein
MGLSYRPGGASWPHGGFDALRRQIAAFEGIDDLERWWKTRHPYEYDEGSGTPLTPWLNGHGQDGFFTASQCQMMIPRFEVILKYFGDHLSPFDRSNLVALVRGMQFCAEHDCAMSWG